MKQIKTTPTSTTTVIACLLDTVKETVLLIVSVK
jgi:hypothetical protein